VNLDVKPLRGAPFPNHYDLTINTGKMRIEAAVEAVFSAVKAKKGTTPEWRSKKKSRLNPLARPNSIVYAGPLA
jgi:hypothetical protein